MFSLHGNAEVIQEPFGLRAAENFQETERLETKPRSSGRTGAPPLSGGRAAGADRGEP